ncbi:hypothetical protein ACFC1R_07185 [Kitasatospora sp. NPDC056138]|uniref:hypothetical protein n=1 Tax=Kitasatospora sp. NPDC056138 TaxID=3345724 RepID=UPI0035DEC371
MFSTTSRLKKFAARAMCSAVLLAAPLLAAQPAAADGPRTPQEAAVCKGLMTNLFGGSERLGQQNIDALCAVQQSAGSSGS